MSPYTFKEDSATDNAPVKAAAAGVGIFILGIVLLFTVGRPMGWPLGWWFNSIFIGMGAMFFGFAMVDVFRDPARTPSADDIDIPGAGPNTSIAFLILGPAILLLAVFMGAVFPVPQIDQKTTDNLIGGPPAVRVCQAAPFRGCLDKGRFMGRFEGLYLASLETSGRVSDVKFQSNLSQGALQCLENKILALQVKDYHGDRMAVMCQFIGSSMPAVFKISLNPGYRRLEAGEPLMRPGPGGTDTRTGTETAGQAQPGSLPVEHPNVQAHWSGLLATPNCTFWSGPEHLGRDDILGTGAVLTQEKGRATLLFGGSIAFSGRWDDGALTLRRKSRHQGGRWEVTETLTLRKKGRRVLAGEYLYTECDHAGKEGCPGPCRIQAAVEIRPEP
ncbi:MAG: hypothetical protein GXP49_04905 [Deltaproteobacteria bacterium]|nr:hypothetical protein [Deltaproteobacteria bacterium]